MGIHFILWVEFNCKNKVRFYDFSSLSFVFILMLQNWWFAIYVVLETINANYTLNFLK